MYYVQSNYTIAFCSAGKTPSFRYIAGPFSDRSAAQRVIDSMRGASGKNKYAS